MFANRPELQTFEDLLQGLAAREADVYLAMKNDGLTAEAGAAKLAELFQYIRDERKTD